MQTSGVRVLVPYLADMCVCVPRCSLVAVHFRDRTTRYS